MRSVIDSLFLETALTSIAMEKTVGFASAPKVLHYTLIFTSYFEIPVGIFVISYFTLTIYF